MKTKMRQRTEQGSPRNRAAESAQLQTRSDAALLAEARDGHAGAFGELWRRHRQAVAALTYPLAFAETDDVVSEAFTAVWEQLQLGQGPAEHFRAYLVSVSRNIASRRYHDSQRVVTDALPEGPTVPSSDEILERYDENSEILAAFTALPVRWQQVLWWQDVDEHPRSEIAERLQLSPNSVSALSRRAREGLRVEWLRQQIPSLEEPRHRDTVDLLPKYVRNALSTAQTASIGEHLAGCPGCSEVEHTLQQHNRRLGRRLGAGGALAFALGGTMTTDLWSPSVTAGALSTAAVHGGSKAWIGTGNPMPDVALRASHTLMRGARRATDSIVGVSSGGSLASAGVIAVAATVTAAAIAVGVSQLSLPLEPAVTSPVTEHPSPAAAGRADGSTGREAMGTGTPGESQSDGGGTHDNSSSESVMSGADPVVVPGPVGSPESDRGRVGGTEQPTAPPQFPSPTANPGVPTPSVPGTVPDIDPPIPVTPGTPPDSGKPSPGHPTESRPLTVARGDQAGSAIAPLLTGTATAHATVRVAVSGQVLEAVSDPTGSWAVDLAGAELSSGTHTAIISQVVPDATAETVELGFTLERPDAVFSIGPPGGSSAPHHGRIRGEFRGIPHTAVCVTTPMSAPYRITLDSAGYGELLLRRAEHRREVTVSYCEGARLGVRNQVALPHHR